MVVHQVYHFRPNFSIWFVAMVTKMLNLQKYSRINSSEGRIKLKRCRIVYNISLYKKIVFHCCCLSILVAVATLNFHRLINGKNESWHLLLFHCRYFDESFLEMFDEWSSLYQTYIFCLNLSIWLVVVATTRLNLRKIFKNQLIRSYMYMGDKTETLQKCS